MKRVLLLLATVAAALNLSGYAQTSSDSTPDAKVAATSKVGEARETEVYYKASWEVGEFKDCSTLPRANSLLICDGNGWWFDIELKCVGSGGLQGRCEKEAISAVRQKSKSFLVKFSQEPWPTPRKEGDLVLWWKCTKKDTVSCSSEGPPK